MTFEITKLREHCVGGLVLPGMEPNGRGQKAELLAFTQDRVRARGLQELLVLYVCHAEVGWTALVGTRCKGLYDLTVGDSLFRVPTAYFAHFRPDDDSDADEDLWSQVDEAEKEERIDRAYRGEIAVVGPSGTTDLYVSLL
ncbi:hypothetical protein Y013_21670 [Rhodococcus pyridinivorans SB3094]|uniref:Uncharacterized protein n=1 Tax=Rhodococcus pyridinivorans SB3094 TaxID=1435356 RepID=V9XNX7_9NOCA|nr:MULTISPECIES: hypothetical protein [Rhodococcus]AHD23052.1 hypothetical protein Y013_21670 [Rhodococcus pyridinivorans SB3094]MCT7290794.1 hypothetical protein [Rhodococcus sp. PAE-6]